jgi:DNA-binding LacI/PurR family transcriptional regulator
MRARIEKVAAMLGYRPSRLPGIMRRGKSGIVAVVVGGFYNPFHTMTLESFTRALTSAGRQVMLVQVESDRDLDEAVGDLVALNIDGVVSALSISSSEVAAVLDRHRLPIVTLNSAIESEWVRAVNSDNKETGRQAARTLHASGSQEFERNGSDRHAQPFRPSGRLHRSTAQTWDCESRSAAWRL